MPIVALSRGLGSMTVLAIVVIVVFIISTFVAFEYHSRIFFVVSGTPTGHNVFHTWSHL